jgi:hypothetical protein
MLLKRGCNRFYAWRSDEITSKTISYRSDLTDGHLLGRDTLEEIKLLGQARSFSVECHHGTRECTAKCPGEL